MSSSSSLQLPSGYFVYTPLSSSSSSSSALAFSRQQQQQQQQPPLQRNVIQPTSDFQVNINALANAKRNIPQCSFLPSSTSLRGSQQSVSLFENEQLNREITLVMDRPIGEGVSGKAFILTHFYDRYVVKIQINPELSSGMTRHNNASFIMGNLRTEAQHGGHLQCTDQMCNNDFDREFLMYGELMRIRPDLGGDDAMFIPECYYYSICANDTGPAPTPPMPSVPLLPVSTAIQIQPPTFSVLPPTTTTTTDTTDMMTPYQQYNVGYENDVNEEPDTTSNMTVAVNDGFIRTAPPPALPTLKYIRLLFLQLIENAQSLETYQASIRDGDEWVCILLQIMMIILFLNRIDFIHYDLHLGNVLVRRETDRNRILYQFEIAPHHAISFQPFVERFLSQYGYFPCVSIIDFGYSVCRTVSDRLELTEITSVLYRNKVYTAKQLQYPKLVDLVVFLASMKRSIDESLTIQNRMTIDTFLGLFLSTSSLPPSSPNACYVFNRPNVFSSTGELSQMVGKILRGQIQETSLLNRNTTLEQMFLLLADMFPSYIRQERIPRFIENYKYVY